jgi:aldehyde dehydrogenase (NAD+)
MIQGTRPHFIAGRWCDPANGWWFETVNPATGETLAEVARGDADDVDRAVTAARSAFESWGFSDPLTRGRLLAAIAERIRAEAHELARLESLDNGKPLRQARVDVEVAARYFEFYAGAVDKVGGQTIPVAGDFLDYTLREPLGVCAQIVPWNYPLQIGSRGIAAPLAVGNCVVVKPAEETPLTTLELARIGAEVGLPPGTLNVVCGYGEEAGVALARHAGINHITFTGSVEVGSAVMAAAAANIVPVTLELRGKSPNVVFASADLDRAVPLIVNSIIQNAGQTCSAGSRLLVEEAIHEPVVTRMLERFATLRLGPGLNDPDLGPLISARQCERVRAYLELARGEGVAVRQAAVQDSLPEGYYVPATLLDGVTAQSRLFQEEIFGPVVAVTTFRDEQEVICLANSTAYGLVAAVWASNVAQAHRVARRIRAGQVFINSYGAGGGAEMTFGGYGKSGFGREKGLEALRSYTQVKNVCVYVGGE